MTRTMIMMLGAFGGFLQGMVLFVLVNRSLDAPFDVFTSGAWLDYTVLTFGVIGMLCGAAAGWAAYAWTSKDRVYQSVPRKPPGAGSPPFRGPLD
jgi:hypothetical protein